MGSGEPDRSDGAIDLATVEHVARLARLALSAEEQELMQRELASILAYVDELRSVDTSAVEPTSHVLPLVNVLRGDEVRPSYPVEIMLANAPDAAGDLVRVPRILED